MEKQKVGRSEFNGIFSTI